MSTAAYPPPPAPVGTTPTLYLTPQLEKRPDGLAPSLLDLSTAIKTGSTHDSSSSLACKSYRTSSQYLKATPKDDSRELQTIVDSIMSTLEAMTDAKSGTKDLVSMTFEPQGCVWSLEFNPRLRAQNYQLQVICKGCADSKGNNAYVVDTVLVPKRKPSQQDSGLKEATEAFEFAQLQVRKAIVKLEFPDFPEGCKGRPFREVYQLNARVSVVLLGICIIVWKLNDRIIHHGCHIYSLTSSRRHRNSSSPAHLQLFVVERIVQLERRLPSSVS